MTWPVTKIGLHCTVTSSKRFHLSERTTEGVPFYCSKEIIQKCRGEEVTECDYIPEELYLDIASKFGVPQANDLLVTTRGTIGVPYLYQTNDRFYFADGNLTWLKDFDDLLLPQYLYYWFLTNEGKKKIDAIAKGTAQKAVPIVGIKDIEVQLPPLATQRRIADILSAYDDLIENNQKQIKLLEEAAQRLYREWFVELRFPGHEMTPVVDGVPEGWEIKKVVDLSATLRRGISPVYNDKAATRVINQKCIRQTIVDYSESRMQEKVYPEELALRDSDTVICSTGAGTLGRVGQIHGECPDTTLDSHVTLVRANASIGKQFLFWSLKAQQAFFMGAGKGSTNQLELSRETIGSLEVLVPTNTIMCAFEQYAQAIHDKQTACTQQNILLKDARDRLLPKLMSGEVEV